MSQVDLMYRIDIGFNKDRGYAALIQDRIGRVKGLKGASVEQLMSRLRHIIIDEEGRRKNFPVESEPAGQSRIITPNGGYE